MFCENCGAKALDDAVFCQKCGAKINYDTVEQKQKESFVERENPEVMIEQEQPKEFINQIQEMSKASFQNEGISEKKKSNKIGIILGIIALIIVSSIIFVSFDKPSIDYIGMVKEYKPYDETQGLKANYGEIFDKYLTFSTWKERSFNNHHYVDIEGTVKGTNQELTVTIELKPDSDRGNRVFITPKSVVLEGAKSREGDDAVDFLYGMFMAYEKGYEDLSELIAMFNEKQNSADKNLSEIYKAETNNAISKEEAEKLIYEWIEAGHRMGYVCYPEYTGEGRLESNDSEVYYFNLFVSRAAWLPIMVEKTTGNLLVDIKGEIISLDDYYNDYHLKTWGAIDEPEVPAVKLDDNLVGRWRSFDGKKLTLSSEGFVPDTFVFWNTWNRKPDYVKWEAANGRLFLSAYRDTEYEYLIREGGEQYIDDGAAVETDELVLQKTTGAYAYYYRKKTGDLNLAGVWIPGGDTLSGNFILNEDGTGMIGNNSMIWDVQGDYFCYTSEEKAYFDYTINGNVLTLFFSNGSEIFTKVGN